MSRLIRFILLLLITTSLFASTDRLSFNHSEFGNFFSQNFNLQDDLKQNYSIYIEREKKRLKKVDGLQMRIYLRSRTSTNERYVLNVFKSKETLNQRYHPTSKVSGSEFRNQEGFGFTDGNLAFVYDDANANDAIVKFVRTKMSQVDVKVPVISYADGFFQFHWLSKYTSTFDKISTFGIMLALAFLFGNFLLQKEFFRIGLPVRMADNIVILGVIGGISGSKLFVLWEQWSSWHGWAGFKSLVFSGGGLTWYGGFILAGLSIAFYIKKQGYKFWATADYLAPTLAVGYGIGRFGCMFSGDGCYGTVCPSRWPAPFAMSFKNGAAQGSWLEIMEKAKSMGIDPHTVVVYNTPFMESLFAFLILGILWSLRKRGMPPGIKFMFFVFTHAVFRFFIEFIRLNPRDQLWGMSQGQLISVTLCCIVAIYLVINYKNIAKFIKDGFQWQVSLKTGIS